MVLLESVAAHDGFDAEDFSTRWREFFTDNDTTYVDSATRTTMRNLGEGDPFMEAGSSSHDLAGAGRIGPLVYCYRSQPDPLVDAARTQTRLTHNNDTVIAAADFFAKVAVACLDNVHPVEAMRTTAEHDDIAPIRKMVEQGIGAVEEESTAYIAKVGQACPAERALPATVQLIARYAENGREALIQNVMAGGDSAGRGLLVGLVLGAYQGRDAADPAWIEGMSARDRALELLGKMS
jgi:ADP-ribosylglycohydrolase